MNKLLLLGIFFSFTCLHFAQNVVKVGSKHNKTLIYTFKEGENLTRGESRVNLKSDGIGYEFCIQTKDYRYILYKDGKSVGEFNQYTFSDDAYMSKSVMKAGEKLTEITLKNGKKFGPYQSAYPVFGNKQNEITGISYRINEMDYLISFFNNKTYGPYKDIYVIRLNTNDVLFTYKDEKGEYLVRNNETFGPYKSCKAPYFTSPEGQNNSYFFFLNDEGDWKINLNGNILEHKFVSKPDITFLSETTYKIYGDLKDDNSTERVTIVKDKTFTPKDKNESYVFNSYGEVLRVETLSIGKSYDKPVNIFKDEKLLGTYKRQYISESRAYNSKAFQFLFVDTAKNDNSKAYIYKDNELVLVGNAKDIYIYNFYLVNDDFYYVRKSDSTLMKNGIETSHKKVTHFEIKKFPNEFLIIKQDGKNEVFIYNGKELSSDEIRKIGYYPEYYDVKDKPINFEIIDGKTYVNAKGSTKKFGPVGRYNDFFFSKNNAHLAEGNNRKMEIYIDNKLFSSGFSLNFNPKTNNFHWFSIDNNKLYLHTYNNN